MSDFTPASEVFGVNQKEEFTPAHEIFGEKQSGFTPAHEIFNNNPNTPSSPRVTSAEEFPPPPANGMDQSRPFLDRAKEQFKQGFGGSVSGLIEKIHSGDLNPEPQNEPQGLGERLAHITGQAVGDLPAMLAGGLAGGPVTGMAGAFALPAVIRSVLEDHIKNGDLHGFSDWMRRLSSALKEGGKAALTGAATGGAGAVVGRLGGGALTKLGAEAVAMPVAGSAVEGRLPTANDMIDSAILLGSVHGGVKGVEKLRGLGERGSIGKGDENIEGKKPAGEPETTPPTTPSIQDEGIARGGEPDASMTLRKESPMEEPAKTEPPYIPEGVSPPVEEVERPTGIDTIKQAQDELKSAQEEMADAHAKWVESGGHETHAAEFEQARAKVEQASTKAVQAVNDFTVGDEVKTLPLEVAGRIEKGFIKNPDTGGVDFESITPDIIREAKEQSGGILEPAPIRLLPNDAEHIWERRGGKLADLGYNNPEEFVSAVVKDYTEIRRGVGDTLLLLKTNGDAKVAYVELRKAEDGDYYKVNSAFVDRPERISLHKRELIWRRSEPSLPGSGPDTHLWPPGDASLSPSSKETPDRNGPSDKGQNNSSINIRPEPENIKDSDESPRPPLQGGESSPQTQFIKGESDNPLSNERGEADLRKRSIYNDEVRPHIEKKLVELNRQGNELRRRLGQAGSVEDRVSLKAEIKANGEAIEELNKAKMTVRMHEVTQKALDDSHKFSIKKWWAKVLREVVDRSGNVKGALRRIDAEELERRLSLAKTPEEREKLEKEFKANLGGMGSRAERDLVLQAGAPANALAQIERHIKDIYGGLSPAQSQLLDHILESKRTAIIDRYRDDIAHPHGLDITHHEAFLKYVNESAPDAQMLNARADKYFAVMKDQLVKLHEHGLLDDKAFDALVSKGGYMKRKPVELLDAIDPERGAEPITIKDAGIKRLDQGTVGGLEKNSRSLLAEVVALTETRIARNEANKSLYELGRKQPENGLVTIAEQISSSAEVKKQNLDKAAKWAQDRIDALNQKAEEVRGRLSQSSMSAEDMGKWAIERDREKAKIQGWLDKEKKAIDSKQFPPEFAPAPDGQVLINAVVDGKTVGMYMPDEMANEWTTLDPAINQSLANIAGWVTGTKLLKMTATGYNPLFALTNMPRDMARTLLVTNEYHSFLPAGLGQMAADFARVAPDLFRNRGRLTDYINEGGGMELLTLQGRGAVPDNPVLKALQKFASYAGEKSELWTRLALRERAFNNMRKAGRTDTIEMWKDATFIARGQMDFSQGGRFAKALDFGIPFLNASIQGSRGYFKAAANNPGLLLSKTAQLILLGAGIDALNRMWNNEAYKHISDYTKTNYHVFVLPESIFPALIDENGNKRWPHLKIAKDQEQRSITAIGQALSAIAHGEKPDISSIVTAAGALIPGAGIVPSFQAYLGYASNKDFFHNREIWKGRKEIEPNQEFTARTNPAWVKFGEATGLSPERAKHAAGQVITPYNTFVEAGGYSLGKIMDSLSGKERRELSEKIVRDNPLLSRIIQHTLPEIPKEMQRAKEINIKHNTKDYVVHRDFLDVLRGFDENKDVKPIREFIRKAEPDRRQDLLRDFTHWRQMSNIKNFTEKSWWLDLRSSSPAARAEIYWEKYKEAEPAKQKDMQRLLQQIPGIRTERFMHDLGRLQRGR